MTAPVWSIEANGNAVTDVELVSFDLRVGQKYILEPLSSSSLVIRGRYPTGFASPNPDLVINAVVELFDDTDLVWAGRVTDVSLELGAPNVAGVGNADYVTVNVEGMLGVAGRTNVTTTASLNNVNSFPSGNSTTLQSALGSAGIRVLFPQTGEKVQVTDREWNGLELLQNIWNTYPYVLQESKFVGFVQAFAVYLTKGYGGLIENTVNFSDAANNSTNQVYDQIMLDSLSESYYSAAEMTRSATGATGKHEVGSAPYVLYTGETLATTDEANLSRAEAIANVYSQTAFDIVGISCLSEAQNNWNLWLGNIPYEVIGTYSDVTFRGTTTNVIIIGLSISATPESSRFTFHCTPTRYFDWFTLDDIDLGVLDQNRLFYTID